MPQPFAMGAADLLVCVARPRLLNQSVPAADAQMGTAGSASMLGPVPGVRSVHRIQPLASRVRSAILPASSAWRSTGEAPAVRATYPRTG